MVSFNTLLVLTLVASAQCYPGGSGDLLGLGGILGGVLGTVDDLLGDVGICLNVDLSVCGLGLANLLKDLFCTVNDVGLVLANLLGNLLNPPTPTCYDDIVGLNNQIYVGIGGLITVAIGADLGDFYTKVNACITKITVCKLGNGCSSCNSNDNYGHGDVSTLSIKAIIQLYGLLNCNVTASALAKKYQNCTGSEAVIVKACVNLAALLNVNIAVTDYKNASVCTASILGGIFESYNGQGNLCANNYINSCNNLYKSNKHGGFTASDCTNIQASVALCVGDGAPWGNKCQNYNGGGGTSEA